MRGRTLAALMACAALAGCEKIEDFSKKQAALEERIAKLEKQITLLNDQLLAASKPESRARSVSFNDCVLENMRGINSDLAAESVKESCLRIVSESLTDLSALSQSKAGYGKIYGYLGDHSGLHVTLSNSSPFTITELAIAITDKKSKTENVYVARTFPAPLPPNVIASGPPRDRTRQMQLTPGQHVFTLQIAESVPDSARFFDRYGWALVSAKGFLN